RRASSDEAVPAASPVAGDASAGAGGVGPAPAGPAAAAPRGSGPPSLCRGRGARRGPPGALPPFSTDNHLPPPCPTGARNGARPAKSSLPEVTHYLVRQGFHQVRYYLSLAGLDKSFHRHSRHQAHVAEPSDLLPAQGNPQRVVGSRGALIDRGIGGNARDQ